MHGRAKRISVFGGSKVDNELYDEAVEAGKCLAELGFEVLNGGYEGVMEAVSKGVVQGGGSPVGVTCDIFGSASPNKYIQKEIRCSTLYSRLETLIENADGYLVFPGSTGTMTEYILTFEIASKFILPAPVIFWKGFWQSIVHQIQRLIVVGDYRIETSCRPDVSHLNIEFAYNLKDLKTLLHKYL